MRDRRGEAGNMGHFIHFDITVPSDGQANAAIRTDRDRRGMISGVVLDAAGLSVPGAAVQLYAGGQNPADGPEAACFTDEEGCFLFGPVEPGRHYRLRVFIPMPAEERLKEIPCRRAVEEPDSPAAYRTFKDVYKQ